MKRVITGFDGKGKRRTVPAGPRAKKNAAKRKAKLAPPPPEREGASWVGWRDGRAIVNVRRVPQGREVLVGAKAERCPACAQMGICVEGKWWHEVDVDKVLPMDGCELEMKCPECNGTGRVRA